MCYNVSFFNLDKVIVSIMNTTAMQAEDWGVCPFTHYCYTNKIPWGSLLVQIFHTERDKQTQCERERELRAKIHISIAVLLNEQQMALLEHSKTAKLDW